MKLGPHAFPMFCERNSLPRPVTEYRFHVTRLWRFDWAWPEEKVALEVEGGAWTRGRHTRGKGFVNDIEKYNYGALEGWLILRCVPSELYTYATLDMIKAAIKLQNERNHQ